MSRTGRTSGQVERPSEYSDRPVSSRGGRRLSRDGRHLPPPTSAKELGLRPRNWGFGPFAETRSGTSQECRCRLRRRDARMGSRCREFGLGGDSASPVHVSVAVVKVSRTFSWATGSWSS